jgi:hypothetical protein
MTRLRVSRIFLFVLMIADALFLALIAGITAACILCVSGEQAAQSAESAALWVWAGAHMVALPAWLRPRLRRTLVSTLLAADVVIDGVVAGINWNRSGRFYEPGPFIAMAAISALALAISVRTE